MKVQIKCMLEILDTDIDKLYEAVSKDGSLTIEVKQALQMQLAAAKQRAEQQFINDINKPQPPKPPKFEEEE